MRDLTTAKGRAAQARIDRLHVALLSVIAAVTPHRFRHRRSLKQANRIAEMIRSIPNNKTIYLYRRDMPEWWG